MNTKYFFTGLLLLPALCTAYSQEQPDHAKSTVGQTFVQPNKLFHLTEIGLMAGNSNNEHSAPFAFHYALNYTLVGNLSAGLGAGVEFYRETYLPVTANATYRFGNKRISPFASLQAGYLIGIESNTNRYYGYYYSYYPSVVNDKLKARGGFLITPSFGVIVRLTDDFGLTLSAGYRHHQMKYVADQETYFAQYIEYNRLLLKFGIIF